MEENVTPIMLLDPALALTGDEWYPIVQNGVTKRVKLSDIAEFLIPGTAAIYTGSKPTADLPDTSQIRAGDQQAYIAGADIQAEYANAEPMFNWAAWPAAEAGIDAYFIDEWNNEHFGPNSLFATPVQIGNFWFTQNNYATGGMSVTFQH